MRRDVVIVIPCISPRIPIIDIDVARVSIKTGAAPRGKRVKIDVVGVARNRYRTAWSRDRAPVIIGVGYIPITDRDVSGRRTKAYAIV